MTPRIEIDRNDFRYKIKTPALKESERREIVISALIEATENSVYGGVKLTPTPKNQLDKLHHYEIVKALEAIVKESGGAFAVTESNYGKEIVPENEREDSIVFDGRAKNREPLYRPAPLPDGTPVTLALLRGFDNWRYSYLHKKTIQLKDLSPANFQKIHSIIIAMDEKFELNSSPDVEIEWNPLGDYDNHDARQDALNFLSNKGVVKEFRFIYSNMGGVCDIKIHLSIREFQAFKEEVYKLAKKQPPSPPVKPQASNDPKQPFKSRKWEEISIQFLDGNNTKITAKNGATITAHYKEMGFEDARSRKPNQQWDLLRLLAENNGELSWENSDAKDAIKKKKQLLSKSLQDYFGIENDPFFPYKEEKSYRLKITLLPESERQ